MTNNKEWLTAQDFINDPDSPYTLDFLSNYEREIIYQAIEIYAAGKVRQATKGNTCPHCDITPVMCKCCGEVLP